ncbi:MAG: S-layer homology domain-containing protein [Oscillospiraceae bacterium]|nr:S-layer homology domain-containing protein [Oscillospiraceae bacterium]
MLKRVTAIALCAALLACAPGLAMPGTASDPAVTRGYIDQDFLPPLERYAGDRLDAALAQTGAEAQELLNRLRDLTAGLKDENAARNVSQRLTFRADTYQPLRLEAGYALAGGDGTQFIVRSGWVQAGAEMSNFTDGTVLPYSADAPHGKTLGCIGSGVLVAHNPSEVLVKGYYRILLPPETRAESRAEALRAMGLVAGTGSGFAPERLMTRSEGVILMLNLFGEQARAAAHASPSPFSDVNGTWAERGIAYAHSRGYVSGASPTAFLPNNLFSADMFFTLILTALGYEGPRDFQWNNALDFAAQIGVVPRDFVAPARDHWNRDRMFYAAYHILGARYKDTNVTVLDRLIADGVVDRAAAEAAMKNVR